MSATVREADYGDWKGINAVLARARMARSELSADAWASLWRDNPLIQDDPSIPIGWVLEFDRRIVGFLGNVPLGYVFRGRRIVAAAARGFAVDTEHRAQTLKLVAAFFSQRGVDLFLNTTANAAAGAIFQLAKADRLPQRDYDEVLFWVTGSRGFLRSALRKRGWSGGGAATGAAILFPVFSAWQFVRRMRAPAADAYEVHEEMSRVVAGEIESLWRRTVNGRPERLSADRSARTLCWHFSPARSGEHAAKFIVLRRSGIAIGYAAIRREDVSDIQLRRQRVVDLLVENDDAEGMDVLLRAAAWQARTDGCHVLEVVGFPSIVRARAANRGAMRRHFPAWPYWYKARAVELREALRDESAWYACAFDGDASL